MPRRDLDRHRAPGWTAPGDHQRRLETARAMWRGVNHGCTVAYDRPTLLGWAIRGDAGAALEACRPAGIILAPGMRWPRDAKLAALHAIGARHRLALHRIGPVDLIRRFSPGKLTGPALWSWLIDGPDPDLSCGWTLAG